MARVIEDSKDFEDWWERRYKVDPMWKPDGWQYVECRRCGINLRVPERDSTRQFCGDCKYPDFMAPYTGGWGEL